MNRLRSLLHARRDAPAATPSLRQVQETECGVVALAIILGHHGAWVPLPELRQRCQVSAQGVNGIALVQAARHYGLAIRAMRVGVDALRHIPVPAILFWEHWHFVVLEGIRGDTAWINDPARGRRTIPMDALAGSFSGVALVARPEPGFQPTGSPRRPVADVARMLQPGRRWLVMLGGAVLAESLLLPRSIALLGDAIGDEPVDRSAAWGSLALAVTGLLAARVAGTWLGDRARDATTRPLLDGLTADLSRAPASFIEARAPADLADRPRHAGLPGATAVKVLSAGIPLIVATPLLVIVVVRVDPLAGGLTLLALLATSLMRQVSGIAAAHRPPPSWPAPAAHPEPDVTSGRGAVAWLVAWWPAIRPCLVVLPAIVAGAATGEPVNVLVTLLASGFALRIAATADASFGMLRQLPESLVQLLDRPPETATAEPGTMR